MVSVGNILDGKVVGIMPFGAFVSFGENQSGLVHISEISDEYVKDINDHLKKGDSVKVKVITRGELTAKIELETQFASKTAVEALKKAGGSFRKVAILKRSTKKNEA